MTNIDIIIRLISTFICLTAFFGSIFFNLVDQNKIDLFSKVIICGVGISLIGSFFSFIALIWVI